MAYPRMTPEERKAAAKASALRYAAKKKQDRAEAQRMAKEQLPCNRHVVAKLLWRAMMNAPE